ncbi:MAG: TrkA C-terminal domain-containing protein [Phycisphaerales bacterium]
MPVLALLIIVAIALVIVRIGATALMMTGLSRDVAEFQAVSCFFGVGFTTSESEMIVSHPARRKIASHLIIAGNIGLTGALSTVIITFVQPGADGNLPTSGPAAFFLKLAIILFGIIAVGLIFRVRLVKRLLEAIIKTSLEKIHNVRAIDYETILRSKDGFAVMQVEIDQDHRLIGRTLAGAKLSQEGVLVLGIERASGEYIGATHSTTEINEGDILTVYGHEAAIVSVLES